MLKKAILPLMIIVAGVLSVSVLVVAKPKPSPKPAAEEPGNVKITVVEVAPKTMSLSVSAQGTVVPKREIDLVAQVSGQIVSVNPSFVDGGFFSESQVLIQIDDRDYKIALLGSQAQLAEAERRLAEEQGLSRQAKREWRDLGNQSANDLFVRKPQLAAALANLEAAKANVEMAKITLERTKIHVPFNGRVRQTYADLGQIITAGTRLATVYDSSVVEIRIPLTEKQAALVDLPFTAQLAEGQESKVLPSVMINGHVAGEEYQWQGILARTDAFVDASSRMYFAIVEVQNPFLAPSLGRTQSPLLPGIFVNVVIEGKSMPNVIALPRTALYQRDQVLALDENNKIFIKKANVLRKSKNKVWLQADLKNKTLVSIEKQSLTPTGTIVDPILKNDKSASKVDQETASPKLISNSVDRG